MDKLPIILLAIYTICFIVTVADVLVLWITRGQYAEDSRKIAVLYVLAVIFAPIYLIAHFYFSRELRKMGERS